MSENLEENQDRAERLLLEFLDGRDAECPSCGYNLRDLTKPVCPECREELKLSVGFARMKFGLLVAAIIPGAFSLICAALLFVAIVIGSMFGPVPPQAILLDAFGGISGLFAMGFFARRHAFLKRTKTFQMEWVIAIWFVHLLAFGILLFMIY